MGLLTRRIAMETGICQIVPGSDARMLEFDVFDKAKSGQLSAQKRAIWNDRAELPSDTGSGGRARHLDAPLPWFSSNY